MRDTQDVADVGAQRTAESLLFVQLMHPRAETIICQVIGEVDLCTTLLLKEKLTEATDTGSAHLVVDLSDITFISSSGLRALFCARGRQETSANHLALVTNFYTRRLLRAVGLDQEFDIYDDLRTALDVCRA